MKVTLLAVLTLVVAVSSKLCAQTLVYSGTVRQSVQAEAGSTANRFRVYAVVHPSEEKVALLIYSNQVVTVSRYGPTSTLGLPFTKGRIKSVITAVERTTAGSIRHRSLLLEGVNAKVVLGSISTSAYPKLIAGSFVLSNLPGTSTGEASPGTQRLVKGIITGTISSDLSVGIFGEETFEQAIDRVAATLAAKGVERVDEP